MSRYGIVEIGFPYHHQLIYTTSAEEITVGREVSSIDSSDVALHGVQQAALADVPNSHSRVCGGGEEVVPGRMHGDRGDRTFMSRVVLNELAAAEVPDLD